MANVSDTLCFIEIHPGIIFACCLSSLCFFVGTPAQLWCLWFCLCIERKSKQIQVFSVNYIIMEIIFCTLCAAETLNVCIFHNHKLNIVIMFFVCIAWIGRPLMQSCICFEQYLAVIHPVTFVRYKDLKFRVGAAAAVWVIAVGYGLYKTTTLSFPDLIVDTVFVMTVIVISFFCMSVLRALKNPGPGETTGRNVGNQQKRNAFNVILLALLINLFTYVPQAFLMLFEVITIDQTLMMCDVVPVVTSLSFIAVLITPLIKMYKEDRLKLFRHCKEHTENS